MRRFILFMCTAVIFALFAIFITFTAINDKKNTSIFLQPVIPVLYVSLWLIFMAIDEKKNKTEDSFFSYSGYNSAGGFAFIGKKYIVPFFLIMFGTVSLSITGAFLGSSKHLSDFSWVILGTGFMFGLITTIYFLKKLRSNHPEQDDIETEMDNTGVKVAVFFASIATFGLFYILWRYIRKKQKIV